MKKITLVLLCSMLCASFLSAQQPRVNWTTSMEPMKRFIENKGQFDDADKVAGAHVLYAVDHGNTKIYFTAAGVTFYLQKLKKREPEHEKYKEELNRKLGFVSNRDEGEQEEDRIAFVNMQWVDANPTALLMGMNATSDYFSYSVEAGKTLRNVASVKAYERLLYKNLYPNIDVEYTFHSVGGIKYKIIVHPGADAAKVKMLYKNAERVLLDEIGNIRLTTEFGDIVDNAPITFYEESEKDIIPSSYALSGNTVSFKVDKHKKNKTVIIDPWTITPTMPTLNKVYNIKTDTSGNAYLFGGDSPIRLQKYDATGTLQWTYNTPWGPTTWGFGGLAVDPAGNSFITSGDGQITKINTTGGLVWTNGGGGFAEYWTPVFNCDYTQLLVGGTNTPLLQFFGSVFHINLNNGAVINTVNVAGTLVGAPNTPPFIPNEVRTICYSPNGNYYFLTLDTIGSLDASLGINFRDSSFYNLAYYMPYGKGDGQGINGICATANLVYTTDGISLHKRDINNGRILSTVTIPNGARERASGIAVDSCGNLYVGSVAMLHKYDANLNLLTTVTTPGEVFDVAVSRSGEVFACGNGFALSVDMNSCNPLRPVCTQPLTATMSQTDALCYGACDGTATATPTNGNAPYVYQWSNGQTTQTANNLCAGTYAITITDASNRTFIGSVDIEQPTLIRLNIISVNAGCNSGAVVTPTGGTLPYTYLWSNGDTLAGITNVPTGTYSIKVTDANNCSVTGSASVVQTSTFTLSQTITKPACGSCNGSATITPSGGTAPYTYAWSTGDSLQTANNLCAGTYTVTVTESIDTSTVVFWNENFTGTNTDWTLNLNGSAVNTTNSNFWVINNNRSACSTLCPTGGSGGNYLHVTCTSFPICASDANSCIYNPGLTFLSINSTTDKYVTSPNISTLGRSNLTLSFWYLSGGEATDYGLVRLSDDGGNSWTDLPTQYFGTPTCTQAIIPLPAQYENIANLRLGFRWINDSNDDGNDPPFMIDDIELSSQGGVAPCSDTAIVNVSSDGGPAIVIESKTDASCNGNADGAADVTVSGGAPPYTYAWTGGDSVEDVSGLEGGIYTLTVTDTVNCIGLASVTINEPPVMFVTGSVTNAGCSPTGRVNLTVNGGTTPYGFAWSSGPTTQNLNNAVAGTYTVTVTDANSCQQTETFTIYALGSVSLAVIVDDVTCYGAADGSVTANITGGNPPYQFSWSNGSALSSLTAISGGTYSVTVADGNNCTATQTATVNEPSLLTSTASITSINCDGDSSGGIKLTPIGGVAPLVTTWSDGGTGLTRVDLPPGIYTATVTDARGCVMDTAFNLSATSIYQLDVATTNASCGGGTDGAVTINILSPTTPPYTYSWNNGSTSATISNLATGTYIVTVVDANNCPRTDTATIVEGGLSIQDSVENTSCPASADGAILVSVTGGTAPYNFSWSNGSSASSLQNIKVGTYTLTVTDQNNCTGNETMTVLLDSNSTVECEGIVIYDIFSPNGDGVNELWIIDGLDAFADNELQIFNRWGSVVFEANPYNNTWNGESKNGELLPSATYYYILKLNDPNNSIHSGHITLIR